MFQVCVCVFIRYLKEKNMPNDLFNIMQTIFKPDSCSCQPTAATEVAHYPNRSFIVSFPLMTLATCIATMVRRNDVLLMTLFKSPRIDRYNSREI